MRPEHGTATMRLAGIRDRMAHLLHRLPRRCPQCHGRVGPLDLLFGGGVLAATYYLLPLSTRSGV